MLESLFLHCWESSVSFLLKEFQSLLFHLNELLKGQWLTVVPSTIEKDHFQLPLIDFFENSNLGNDVLDHER